MNYRARVRTARNHRAKQADLLRIERHVKRCDWIKSEHHSKAFGPLQQHTRRDNAARGMGREVTEGYSQLIKCRQHVKRVLAHGIVGKIGRRRRSVAFAAAAPVRPLKAVPGMKGSLSPKERKIGTLIWVSRS